MTDDTQRRARRAHRIATYTDSENRHRTAIALPPDAIPTIDQLITGAAPSGRSVIEDAQRWGCQILGSPEGLRLPADVNKALREFATDPTVRAAEELEAAALARTAAFEPSITVEDLLGDVADRATLYGAMLGSSEAAGRAVSLLSDATYGYLHTATTDPVPLREVFVTLLHMASLCNRSLPAVIADPATVADWRIGRANARALLATIASVAVAPEELPAGAAASPAAAPDDGDLALDFTDLDGPQPPTRIVLPAELEAKKPSGPAKPLVGKALPLHRMPDLAALGERLVARRPWLVPQISRVLGTLAGRETVSTPNLLFVGLPGTGKTELARELAEGLGVPSLVYGCAGISDSSIQGTSKQWNSARYAVFTQLLVDNASADGIVILDELDKSAPPGGHNGSLREAVVAVGEVSARRRFFDLGLDGCVDISGVSLIATANDVAQLRGPLLDRFTVVEIPGPQQRDMPIVARGIMETLRADMADGRWLADLDDAELSSLMSWKGGSIRPLRRAVERLVALRAHPRFAH